MKCKKRANFSAPVPIKQHAISSHNFEALIKPLILFIGIFFITRTGYCQSIFETENFTFSLDIYLREDLVTFKNVVDLDSANSDDTATYFGIDYNLGFNFKFKDEGPKFYLKLERNGPYDYDAPCFAHNTLMTSGGVIEEYRNDELLPQLEEFWLDAPLVDNFRFKVGLYAYEVGNGFSLNGNYENYGLTLSKEYNKVFLVGVFTIAGPI